jgi:hypothetical protein
MRSADIAFERNIEKLCRLGPASCTQRSPNSAQRE